MRNERVITLASTSPRRKQLLEMLGLPVVVRPPHIPEEHRPGEAPLAYTERLARAKAERVPGDYVIGADTTVVLDGQLLEKPVDRADAVRMLTLLQGRTHEVVTSVALVASGVTHTATDITHVMFRPADRAFLEAYVDTGEPMDKAGAYGIQGFGATIVSRVDGDYFAVMGLPLQLLIRVCGRLGLRYGYGPLEA